MKQLIKVLSYIITLLTLGGLLYFYHSNTSNKIPKIRYLNSVYLFEQFEMSKDIKRLYDNKISRQKFITDSLYKIFQKKISDKESDKQIVSIRDSFQKARVQLENMKQNYAHDLSVKVWQRLDLYITKYVKQQEIDVLLGKDNVTNIWFGKEDWDITNDILKFCNQKYSGERE